MAYCRSVCGVRLPSPAGLILVPLWPPFVLATMCGKGRTRVVFAVAAAHWAPQPVVATSLVVVLVDELLLRCYVVGSRCFVAVCFPNSCM